MKIAPLYKYKLSTKQTQTSKHNTYKQVRVNSNLHTPCENNHLKIGKDDLYKQKSTNTWKIARGGRVRNLPRLRGFWTRTDSQPHHFLAWAYFHLLWSHSAEIVPCDEPSISYTEQVEHLFWTESYIKWMLKNKRQQYSIYNEYKGSKQKSTESLFRLREHFVQGSERCLLFQFDKISSKLPHSYCVNFSTYFAFQQLLSLVLLWAPLRSLKMPTQFAHR